MYYFFTKLCYILHIKNEYHHIFITLGNNTCIVTNKDIKPQPWARGDERNLRS